MGICNALISGSFALQYFEGVRWTEPDLDMFVEDGSDATEMEHYLCKSEGYRVSSERDPNDEVYNIVNRMNKI